MATSQSIAQQRFWSKVDKSSECWLWIACRRKEGYGKVTINEVTYRAHRLSYEWEYGPIAKGLFVLHRCDNPSCVRPSHLFLGTQADNISDMVQKKRGRGTRPLLTPEQKEQVRRLFLSGTTSRPELAMQFGVSEWVLFRATSDLGPNPRGRKKRKLTPVIIAAIQTRYQAGGITQKALRQEYGLSRSSVHRIVRNLEDALAVIGVAIHG